MVFVLYATFAKRDVKILEEKYEVVSYRFNTSSKYLLPIAFIKQFFYLLFNMRKYTAIITQSSGYLSYLPSVFSRVFKKRLVIIAIGTDWASKDYYGQMGFSQEWLDIRNIVMVYIPYTKDVSSTIIKQKIVDQSKVKK